MLGRLTYLVKLHLVTIVFAARQPREVYRWRLVGHVRNLADGRLEQDAKNQKARAIPHRVIYGVIVTVIINGWESHIWWTIGYINLQCRSAPCICRLSRHIRVNIELPSDPNTCGDKVQNLKHAP